MEKTMSKLKDVESLPKALATTASSDRDHALKRAIFKNKLDAEMGIPRERMEGLEQRQEDLEVSRKLLSGYALAEYGEL
jgi:hypothetical protein